jgi:hypothetical protein
LLHLQGRCIPPPSSKLDSGALAVQHPSFLGNSVQPRTTLWSAGAVDVPLLRRQLVHSEFYSGAGLNSHFNLHHPAIFLLINTITCWPVQFKSNPLSCNLVKDFLRLTRGEGKEQLHVRLLTASCAPRSDTSCIVLATLCKKGRKWYSWDFNLGKAQSS